MDLICRLEYRVRSNNRLGTAIDPDRVSAAGARTVTGARLDTGTRSTTRAREPTATCLSGARVQRRRDAVLRRA